MTVKARIRHGGAAAALVALLALAALPQPSFAGDPAPDAVVAKVNGADITEADLAQAALDFRDQLAQMPEAQRRSQLIQHLIDTKLAARRRRGEGPRQESRGGSVACRPCATAPCSLNMCAPRCCRRSPTRRCTSAYDELTKSFAPTDQYQAAHILVKTEDEAKAIIAELDKGGDFAAIAKEKSLDTGSAAKGGDLGFFDPSQMVKPFADAVIAMTVGTYTKTPVQSQFGWHVIKLEATRKTPAPTYEQVATADPPADDQRAVRRGDADPARQRQDRDRRRRPRQRRRHPQRRRHRRQLRRSELGQGRNGGPVASGAGRVSGPAGLGGVRFATAEAGIKYRNRRDVLLMLFDKGTEVAGVFTRSKCPSAPVDWCKAALASGKARALLVNSGNANAFTGKRGREAVKLSAAMAAAVAGCPTNQVFLASTGVIGEPLDATKFDARACRHRGAGEARTVAGGGAAIMTTDTYPKGASRQVALGGATVTINGIAKGAGMIAPDMATLLSFVVTDAPIAAPVLQACWPRGSPTPSTRSPSTATPRPPTRCSSSPPARRRMPRASPARPTGGWRRSARRSTRCSRDLAHQVVRDGEGARKFVEIRVKGAASKKSARRVGMAIANSPLVKTAIAGEDANWGRIVMAVGKAGEPAERDRLAIWFGDVRVAVKGERDPAYSEDAASAEMKQQDIVITVDLGIGTGQRHGVDLRPHQGIRRHQRRLPELRARRLPFVPAVGHDDRATFAMHATRTVAILASRSVRSACALIDRDGRVLITQRPEGKALAGYLGVPRRQDRARRDAGAVADPRARRGTRHRRQRPPAWRRSPSPATPTSTSTC